MTARTGMRVRRAIAEIAMTGLLASCGPPDLVVLPLPIAEFATPIDPSISMRPPADSRPVPFVVLLDDGPPVDVSRRRPVAGAIDQLVPKLLAKGYAVWRPIRDAWPRDSILVRCPEEVAAQVHLGLLAARGLPELDSTQFVVIGFGQGGVLGAVIARRSATSGLIDALALVNTPARSIADILVLGEMRDSVTVARLRLMFDALRAGAYADSQPLLQGRADCWRTWLAISEDMPRIVERLPQPVLAVQGTADSVIPLLDIERLRRAIGDRPRSAAITALGVRHDLRDGVPDPKQEKDIISPRFVPLVLDWLDKVAPPPRERDRRR